MEKYTKVGAIIWAKSMFAKSKFYILDTETTGLIQPEVVEIGIIDGKGNHVFHSLVRPEKPIEETAKLVHGIKEKDLVDCPSFDSLWPKLFPILSGKDLVIYNSSYDVQVIANSVRKKELKNFWKHVSIHCAMRHYSAFKESPKWLKLPNAGHRVMDDVKATLNVMREMAEGENG